MQCPHCGHYHGEEDFRDSFADRLQEVATAFERKTEKDREVHETTGALVAWAIKSGFDKTPELIEKAVHKFQVKLKSVENALDERIKTDLQKYRDQLFGCEKRADALKVLQDFQKQEYEFTVPDVSADELK